MPQRQGRRWLRAQQLSTSSHDWNNAHARPCAYPPYMGLLVCNGTPIPDDAHLVTMIEEGVSNTKLAHKSLTVEFHCSLVRPDLALLRLAVLHHYEEEALQLHLLASWTREQVTKADI